MDIHFNDTRRADAPAATLFEVITDYPGYPDFNPALMQVRLIKHDDTGAGFVADRKTRIGKQVRAYDRYERHQDLVVERSYEGSASARSTWTIHPVDASHSTLTIDASQSMGRCGAW
jgi:ribosome-associated toxin RatA of RatAB toxin-antitoxin module